MALLVHSGTSASDLNASGTKRDDISDVLLASLYFENNVLGLLTVGEEFADLKAQWVEDALNQYQVTDTTSGGQSTSSTSLTLSNADAATLDIGYVLMDNSTKPSGELVQVTATTATTATITRSYGGTTATTHAQNALWNVVNRPTYQNSDLGKDMSRARLNKSNLINRFELNVNIDSEQIIRTRQGYAPGVRDELTYQFQQRMLELKREMQQAFWFSTISTASPGSAGGDYSTMYGLYKWLDGTANSTGGSGQTLTTTAEPLTDVVLNTAIKTIHRNGGVTQVLIGGPNVVEKVGQLYSDRIRLDQNDRNRGFFARYFTPSMANEHRLVEDIYIGDTSGSGSFVIADMSRIRIRPFAEQFFFTITAPTFRDGDAVRALSKWSLEVRNTGTDVGFTHLWHSALSF